MALIFKSHMVRHMRNPYHQNGRNPLPLGQPGIRYPPSTALAFAVRRALSDEEAPLSEPRDLRSNAETELAWALEDVLANKRLPHSAEVEPGALLYLTRDAWKKGPHRDGRAGHLTDKDVADRIQDSIRHSKAPGGGETYDRNKFQLQFGNGKRIGGVLYRQPVQQAVAEAYLQIALEHWRVRPASADAKAGEAKIYEPFMGWDAARRDSVVKAAIAVMYPEGEAVYCREQIGIGPRKLYRDLGLGGYSVVVVARKEAVSVTKPEAQVFQFAELLRLLLQPGGHDAENIHVWAFRETTPREPQRLALELHRIFELRGLLGMVQALNQTDHEPGWQIVPLERCVVAMLKTQERRTGRAGPGPERIFREDTAAVWSTGTARADNTIPIFARTAQGAVRY